MLKRYKNPFFQDILRVGLDVRDFAAEESEDANGLSFDLTFEPADLHFHVRQLRDNPDHFIFGVTRYTGSTTNDLVPRGGVTTFEKAIPMFKEWLTKDVFVAIEEESLLDFWAEAQSIVGLAPVISDESRDKFSAAEREQVKIAIANFRVTLIQKFQPDETQLAEIAERLSYLESAVDRLNRFDWKGVAISTLIGIATNLSLDTERGRLLWGMFQDAMRVVSHMLH